MDADESGDSDNFGDIFSYDDSTTSEIIDSHKVILSVFWKAGKLGAACYMEETQQLQIMNDALDTKPNFNVLRHMVLQLQPTTIISCHSVAQDFIKCIKCLINQIGNAEHDRNSSSSVGYEQLHLYSPKFFNYEVCRNRILAMRILSAPANLSDTEHAVYLQSLIDLNCTMMVSALGGLLYSLDKTLSQSMLQTPSKTIMSVQTLALDNIVWMDDETYNALGIFAPVVHPSAYKWTSSAQKERFSIYSVMNRCFSKLGSRYMRLLLTQPTKSLERLNMRHNVIEFYLKPENDHVAKNIIDCIKNIGNVFHLIIQIIRTEASPAQWKTFFKSVRNVTVLAQICRTYQNEAEFFKEIGNCLDDSLYTISNSMNNLIDFEASSYQGRFVVKSGAITEIDELKERHSNLPQIMEKVARQELQSLPEHIESCSLIYIPEIGYLLAVPTWDENMDEDDLEIPGLNFKFKVNDVLHYKSARCEELDDCLGDSQLLILKHETEVMYQLAEYIQNNLSALIILVNKIMELDCLLSFAIVAREFDLVKPSLCNERIIEIEQGRHILQQLCVATYVPNDYYSLEGDGCIKILTGPNACGKSVYLKQVALIAYLAHIGSFVPAQKAKIGILDHIHTRIQSVESVSVQLSSFVTDLRQMSHCINESTPASLLTIDEFGKGTADVDGLALLTACISHFIEKGLDCPHIIVSTHFHSLIGLLPPSPMVKLQTFEYLLHEDDIVFLYKLKDGSASHSFASKVAIHTGLPKHISERADQVLEAIRSGGVIQQLSNNPRESLTERRRLFLKKLMTLQSEDDIPMIEQLLNEVRR